MPDPLLYQHTDYREYLRRTLEARGVSQRSLANALQRTEGSISQILSERRALSPELVGPIARFLELDEAEHGYLAALVDLHNDSPRARRVAWATVQANLQHRIHAEQFREEFTRVMSSRVAATIQQLADCEGFRADPSWIAAQLDPPVTEQEAEEALTMLLGIGYLTPSEEGVLVSSEPGWGSSNPPAGALSQASYQLQLQMLPLAAEAFERFPPRDRHMSTLVFSLSESQLARVRARLQELEREVVMMALEEDGPRTRTLQLGVQLFPLTRPVDGGSDDHSM